MRYMLGHAGKWVAVKGEQVVAADEEFAPLREKVAARDDAAEIRFALVPKGMITGCA